MAARAEAAAVYRPHLILSLRHDAGPEETPAQLRINFWPTDSQGAEQGAEKEIAAVLAERISESLPILEATSLEVKEDLFLKAGIAPTLGVSFGSLADPLFAAWIADSGNTRLEAIAVYNAVVSVWGRFQEDLEKARAEYPRTRFREGDAESAHWERFHQPGWLARRLWPFKTAPESAEQAQWILDQYKTTLTDATFFYINAHVEKGEGNWSVKGVTNFRMLKDAITGLLTQAGCKPLQNDIELLPSQRLGARRFGVTRLPMALTWREPKEGVSVQSQLLLGDRVFLLDESPDGAYLLVHGADGYVGWVRQDAIRELTEAEFRKWESVPRAVVLKDCFASALRLPAGASLPFLSSDGTAATLALPFGPKVPEEKRKAAIPLENLQVPPATPKADLVVRTAMEYLGVPYVFGGRSRLGIDCSGLTAIAYLPAGLSLPRDAKQQVLVGRLVGTPWHYGNLQPGDLIFFCSENGRVSHAGISLGGMRLIHASKPEVQISSLDPQDPLFSDKLLKEFAVARRPFP